MILKLLPAVVVEINSVCVVSAQFYKRFKDSFVRSLQFYVNRLRMRFVKTLLLTTYETTYIWNRAFLLSSSLLRNLKESGMKYIPMSKLLVFFELAILTPQYQIQAKMAIKKHKKHSCLLAKLKLRTTRFEWNGFSIVLMTSVFPLHDKLYMIKLFCARRWKKLKNITFSKFFKKFKIIYTEVRMGEEWGKMKINRSEQEW